MIEYLQGRFNTLSEDETFELPWHPTRDYTQPALELPCSLVQLRTFTVDASLDCIDENAVAELLAKLPEVNQSSASDAAQAGIGESNQAGDEVKHAQAAVTRQSSEEGLAALFDEVHYRELATMFPTHNDPIKSANDWKTFSARKGRNGLKVAQVSDKGGMFNPYKAARWWIDERNPIGWDWPKCIRKLANSLPSRSKDEKHLLTGTFD